MISFSILISIFPLALEKKIIMLLITANANDQNLPASKKRSDFHHFLTVGENSSLLTLI